MLLDTAQREPITIEKKGRPVAVILSIADYERLEALEDAYWSARGSTAEAEGYIGPDAGEQLLRELLDAKD